MSDDFTKQLRKESQRWEAENLLSPEQRQAILQCYENRPIANIQKNLQADSVREFPLYIRVVLALAVFLIGLAAFLFISFNWDDLPGIVKLSIVGTVLAAAHIGGLVLRATGWKHWADAAFFFAGIMYGVGIWTVGQVFHIPADWPAGLWLWAFGAFLTALAIGSTPLHILSAVLLGVWVCSGSNNLNIGFLQFGFLPFYAYSLPLFVLCGIISGSLKKNQTILMLYLLLFAYWLIMQGGSISGHMPIFHIIAVGLMFFALPRQVLAGTHNTVWKGIGVPLVFGGLTILSFMVSWSERANLHASDLIRDGIIEINLFVYMFWNFVLPLIDAFILYKLFRWSNRQESVRELIRQHKVAFAWLVSFFAIWIVSFFHFMILSLVFDSLLLQDYFEHAGMVAGNVLLVWLAVGLIWNGMKQNRRGTFWSGVLLFMIWAVVRYFDLFSDVGGMLGAAAIFMFCGLFMIGIVIAWTKYRQKIQIEQTVPVQQPEWTMPGWAEAVYCRLVRIGQSERCILAGLVLSVIVQFTLLGLMIADEMRPLTTGTAIKVATMPVDPRDIFRGDYVVLNYEFSDLDSIPGIGLVRIGGTVETVYVSLQQAGELWKAVGISRKKPKEGIFLRGKRRWHRINYGIESYFVQEGKGLEIEDAMRQNNEKKSVIVELMVAPDGKAKIKTVQVKDAVPET